MPIPPFVAELRTHVGHAPLWLTGVSAVVLDAGGRVLLTHRADTRRWAVVSGILEPGEAPGPAIRREIAEETGAEAELVRLTSVDVTPPITYPNGDVVQYLDVCFLAHHIAGKPRVADDENVGVGWFDPAELPEPLAETSRLRIERALRDEPTTWFVH